MNTILTLRPESRKRWDRWSPTIARSLLVWLVLGAIAYFDHPVAVVQRAEFFGWLVPFLVNVGKDVGGVLATYFLEGVKGALAALGGAVRWIIGQLKSFIVSAGAMFAKVWRSLEGFWKNVIRKELLALHDQFIRLRNWLRYIFKPLIDFLDKVRDKIKEIWDKHFKPILDAIDTARRVLAILAKLHIPFAAQLEGYLAKTEQWIIDRYNQLNADLNKVRDTINGILTLDGFLQRFLLLRSIERDVFYVWRALVNSGTRSLTGAEQHKLQKFGATLSTQETTDQIAAHWNGETSDVGTRVADYGTQFAAHWNGAGTDTTA
jgi:hypothetical protein